MNGQTTLKDLIKEIVAGVRSVSGQITDHIREVSGLDPVIIRTDVYTLWAVIGVGGIVPMPQPPHISKDYNFEMTSMWGSWQNAAGQPLELSKVTFNMREAGRNFDVFDYPVNMSGLVNTSGQGYPIEFPRGLYLFGAGSDITPNFQAFANAGALVGANSLVCVFLGGNHIRVEK